MSGEARDQFAQKAPSSTPLTQEMENLRQNKVQVVQAAEKNPAVLAAGQTMHKAGMTDMNHASAAQNFAPKHTPNNRPAPPSQGGHGHSR